ncbi:MAG: MBL fold metallo-hydrolase [Elusimicrobia bacterium]|nr:MBL fold metallo-hydrolase [Elusimicrobiota bacterium]
MGNLVLKQLLLGPMDNYVYLVGDAAAKECAVVDPGWDAPAILKAIEAEGLLLRAVLLTHHHFDHANGIPDLLAKAEVPVYVHKDDAPFIKRAGSMLRAVEDGQTLKVGGRELTFLHTPGHTRGSQCLLIEGRLLTGDTLFIGCCGRVDLPDSDPRKLYGSLRKLGALPDDLLIYPGHNYSPETSARLGDEKLSNPYIAAAMRAPVERFLSGFGFS